MHGARKQVLMAASAVDKVYDAVSEGKARNVGTPSGYAIACACVALLLCSVFVCSFVLFRLVWSTTLAYACVWKCDMDTMRAELIGHFKPCMTGIYI
eukprot:COSAG05_NODE_10051_length_586_cov_0.802875_2_plen_96_part_01